MNIQDCIKFSNENPVCFLATVDGNEPRVRAMGFWFADETGFYFQTASVKEIPEQLRKNPNIEACFYKQEGMIGVMMRLSGKVDFVEDIALKEKVIIERPFLKKFGLTADSPNLVIFKVSHGKAHFWKMENNLLPKDYIYF